MEVWDADDEAMDCTASGIRRKRHDRAYRDILMLSEWMIEVPDNFDDDWLMIVCPVGKRCAVVSSQGRTRVYARNGYEFLTKFPSMLPGGNGSARGSAKHNAILDCIFSESEKTFYVLDVILWNGVSFYGCQTDFRFFWLQSKQSDIQAASHFSSLNKFIFKLLPHFPCDRTQIMTALSDVNFPSSVSD
jgi:snurportin-1